LVGRDQIPQVPNDVKKKRAPIFPPQSPRPKPLQRRPVVQKSAMRHVLATAVVLLIALAGFRYWNAQQEERFAVAVAQAEEMAKRGELNAALETLGGIGTERVGPSLRRRIETKRNEVRTRLLEQTERQHRQLVDSGQLDAANKLLKETSAHLLPNELEAKEREIEQRWAEFLQVQEGLPDFDEQVETQWDEVADTLTAWNATLRNPLKKYQEEIEDLIWQSSDLADPVAKQIEEEKKLAALQDEIAAGRQALPNAPERSLNPFSISRKNLEAKIAKAEQERAQVQARWEQQASEVSSTLRSWSIAEPGRGRSERELRALHRIVTMPAWLNKASKDLSEEEAAETATKLLQCLRSAVEDLPEGAARDKALVQFEGEIGDAWGLATSIRTGWVGFEE